MGIDFVLFDLYGTLIDIKVDENSQEFWAALARDLAARGTKASPEELKTTYDFVLHDELSKLPEGFVMENVLRRVLGVLGMPSSDEAVQDFGSAFRTLSTKSVSLRPYTQALLRAVQASSCKTGIVSNTEAVLTRPDINRFPPLQAVQVMVFSSDVAVKKPDPKIFEIAMERLHVSAQQGVFIGDSLKEDIIGALGANLRCVYLRNNGDELDGAFAKSSVAEASPQLDSILNALRVLGWKEGPNVLSERSV